MNMYRYSCNKPVTKLKWTTVKAAIKPFKIKTSGTIFIFKEIL